jgi:regulatory protein
MPFKRAKKTYEVGELYEYAVGALGRRMRTVAELKRLMRNRVAGQSDGDLLIEAVVIKLKQQRYLNDTSYAESYSRFRKENDKLGRLRVAQDLRAKGVHAEIVEATLTSTYQDVNEEDLARDFLRRRRLAKPADQKQAARIFRALVRAGFPSRVIFRILKKWDVDEETITLLEENSG